MHIFIRRYKLNIVPRPSKVHVQGSECEKISVTSFTNVLIKELCGMQIIMHNKINNKYKYVATYNIKI